MKKIVFLLCLIMLFLCSCIGNNQVKASIGFTEFKTTDILTMKYQKIIFESAIELNESDNSLSANHLKELNRIIGMSDDERKSRFLDIYVAFKEANRLKINLKPEDFAKDYNEYMQISKEQIFNLGIKNKEDIWEKVAKDLEKAVSESNYSESEFYDRIIKPYNELYYANGQLINYYFDNIGQRQDTLKYFEENQDMLNAENFNEHRIKDIQKDEEAYNAYIKDLYKKYDIEQLKKEIGLY